MDAVVQRSYSRMFPKTPARTRDVEVRERFAHQVAGCLFVARIGVGVEEADGEGADSVPVDEVAHRLVHTVGVEGLDDAAVMRDPLADFPAKPPWNQGIGARSSRRSKRS